MTENEVKAFNRGKEFCKVKTSKTILYQIELDEKLVRKYYHGDVMEGILEGLRLASVIINKVFK